MTRFPARGDWRPGLTNPGLLATQLVFLLQAAFRGLDYLGNATPGDRTQRAVEAAAPYGVWGALFYGLALLVLIGVAGRWPTVMIVGHLAFAALYLGMGLLVLSATSEVTALGALGVALCALGTWSLLTSRVAGMRLRLTAGLPLMVAGQLAVALSLGANYRLGTGLALSGAVHAALAAGVSWSSVRQRIDVGEVFRG